MGFSKGFWLVTISSAFFFFSVQMTFPLIPLFVTSELKAAESLIGTAVLLATVSALVLRLPSGLLTDRYGRRLVMIWGAVLGVLYPVSMALSTSVGVFMLSRLVHGVGLAVYTTAIKAYIADVVPVDRRGEAFGVNTSAFSLALILGPLTGEALKNAFDFRISFIAGAFLAGIALLLLFFLPKEDEIANDGVSMLGGAGEVLRLRGAWAAIMTAFAGGGLFAAFFVYFPLYAERLNYAADAPPAIRNITISLAFSLFAIITLFAMPRAGKYSDRHGRVAALIPGIIFSLPGVVVLAIAGNLWLAYVGIAIYSLGFSAIRAMMDALMQDATPHWLRGTGAAVLFGAWDLSIGIMSQIMGMAIERFSFDAMYGLAIAFTILFGLWAIWLSRRVERERITTYKTEFPPLPTQ